MLSANASNALLEDTRGTAGARGVRARHHRPRACAPHDPVAHRSTSSSRSTPSTSSPRTSPSVCEREGVPADPAALEVIARAAAGSMRDALSLLEQAIAHGSLDVDASPRCSAARGSSCACAARRRRRRGRTGRAGRVERVARCGLRPAPRHRRPARHRRAKRSCSRARRDASASMRRPIRSSVSPRSVSGSELPLLVRTLETLGQAIVDMRGTDAADPRLVLEIGLVRLARRDAGPPVQVLVERIERLERSIGSDASDSAASVSARAAASVAQPRCHPARTRRARRRRAHVGARTSATGTARNRRRQPMRRHPPTRHRTARPAPDVDIDDVVLAWAEILPGLPPATRAAAAEAQPIGIDRGVITFGVPERAQRAAEPRSARRPTRSAPRSPSGWAAR